MDKGVFWELFLETGAPEAYLLYAKAQKTEETNVPDNTGTGASDHGLQ